MDVGERLKFFRKNKNVSIYKLSQNSGVSESHIRNLERGAKHSTVETLELLLNSLDITLPEFFNTDDSAAYLSQNEKILLDFFRTLPEKTAEAVIDFALKISE